LTLVQAGNRRGAAAAHHDKTDNPQSQETNDQDRQAGGIVPRFNAGDSAVCAYPNQDAGADNVADKSENGTDQNENEASADIE